MRSLECYFGVYFPRCCATREINTKTTLSWAHKQFATRVHTLLSIYLNNVSHNTLFFHWTFEGICNERHTAQVLSDTNILGNLDVTTYAQIIITWDKWLIIIMNIWVQIRMGSCWLERSTNHGRMTKLWTLTITSMHPRIKVPTTFMVINTWGMGKNILCTSVPLDNVAPRHEIYMYSSMLYILWKIDGSWRNCPTCTANLPHA